MLISVLRPFLLAFFAWKEYNTIYGWLLRDEKVRHTHSHTEVYYLLFSRKSVAFDVNSGT